MSSNSLPIVISLYPAFISHLNIPNVVLVPIEEAKIWDLFVVWQRNKIVGPLRALLSALRVKSK